MSSTSPTLTNTLSKYYNQLPNGIPQSAARSFLGSFAIGVIISGGQPLVGLMGGTLGALASLVDSAIRPLINNLFSNPKGIISLLTKTVLVASIVSVAAPLSAPILGIALKVSIINFVAFNCFVAFVSALFGSSTPANANQSSDYFIYYPCVRI